MYLASIESEAPVTVTADQQTTLPTASTSRGVVVTGAAQGLGKAIARRFAAEGHRVVALDLGEHVQDVVTELGEGHEAVVGDAGDVETLSRAFERATDLGHGLGAVVLNAGVV